MVSGSGLVRRSVGRVTHTTTLHGYGRVTRPSPPQTTIPTDRGREVSRRVGVPDRVLCLVVEVWQNDDVGNYHFSPLLKTFVEFQCHVHYFDSESSLSNGLKWVGEESSLHRPWDFGEGERFRVKEIDTVVLFVRLFVRFGRATECGY